MGTLVEEVVVGYIVADSSGSAYEVHRIDDHAGGDSTHVGGKKTGNLTHVVEKVTGNSTHDGGKVTGNSTHDGGKVTGKGIHVGGKVIGKGTLLERNVTGIMVVKVDKMVALTLALVSK